MAQYNQQFEKHHIATLRKWADVRGIAQARWRSKALQLMIEEAGVYDYLHIPELMNALGGMRQAARENGHIEISRMSIHDLLLVAVLHWSVCVKRDADENIPAAAPYVDYVEVLPAVANESSDS